MGRWAVAVAAIGLAHGAAATEGHSDLLRGSIVATYPVVQTPVQEAVQVGTIDHDPSYTTVPSSTQAPNPTFNSAYESPAPSTWTGFYVGAHVGAGAGATRFTDPFGPSVFGDTITTSEFLAGGQIGYNWQPVNSPWLFGFEADLDWLDSNGTNTCLAYSGFFVSANCRSQPNVLGDVTARVGLTYGHSNHSLVYAKGGAAFIHNQINITTNATGSFVNLPPQVANSAFTKTGWTIGAGVEHAIAPACR
jgi:opacity protein-like surface antigen